MAKRSFAFTEEKILALKVGDEVLIFGIGFTGHVAVHRLKSPVLSLTLLGAVSVRGQLPMASPKAAG